LFFCLLPLPNHYAIIAIAIASTTTIAAATTTTSC
jgi:hypothetical protein